jgi:hypothetical protein
MEDSEAVSGDEPEYLVANTTRLKAGVSGLVLTQMTRLCYDFDAA